MQHGQWECLLNTVEACAIDTWPEVVSVALLEIGILSGFDRHFDLNMSGVMLLEFLPDTYHLDFDIFFSPFFFLLDYDAERLFSICLLC